MGRPFLYSLTYGKEGVVHAIESKFFLSGFPLPLPFSLESLYVGTCESCQNLNESALISVMRDEIATTMRLLGVTRLDQLGPHLVCPLPSSYFT
jgi:L-lactate dehydrogenase (cytochrome)